MGCRLFKGARGKLQTHQAPSLQPRAAALVVRTPPFAPSGPSMQGPAVCQDLASGVGAQPFQVHGLASCEISQHFATRLFSRRLRCAHCPDLCRHAGFSLYTSLHAPRARGRGGSTSSYSACPLDRPHSRSASVQRRSIPSCDPAAHARANAARAEAACSDRERVRVVLGLQ